MAGDWLKMRTRLGEERAVMLICDLTGLDVFAVVGRLHAIWSWAGENTKNGKVSGVTFSTIDRVTCHAGFAAAMQTAKWLESTKDGGVKFPRWTAYNCKAAKERALAAARQAKKRAKSHAQKRDAHRDATVTSHAPREEKRREEKSIGEVSPITPPRRFAKPTVEEVRAYCEERKNSIDPQAFVDSYEAKGWVVGRSPMKDWRAAVRTWEKNNFGASNGNRSISSGRPYKPSPGLKYVQPNGQLPRSDAAALGGS